jgi:hypothetical protein
MKPGSLALLVLMQLPGFTALRAQTPAESPGGTHVVANLTGLPLFPYLNRAAMDPVARTDTLGRWCSRFAGETTYPLDKVEAWYRTALLRASETDLTNDDRYKSFVALAGIKLAVGINYVTVFRVANGAATSIELFHCGSGA